MMASCAALLCTRSNMSFMVAAMAGEKFQVFDMWTDRCVSVGVGSRSSAASPLTSPPNAYTFQSENGLVKGMWVNRRICAFKIYGPKLKDQNNFISSLGQYVILNKFDTYVKLDANQGNQEDMPYSLEGLLDSDSHAMMAEIDVTDPARIGLGVAQNFKLRKHAAALSLLVPMLLDRSATSQDTFLYSLCELAKAKRPAEAG